MKPVSASTEKRLRAALERLLTGNPGQTDGRLTVTNLARDAGVSRATANRASSVLAELRKEAAMRRAQSRAMPRETSAERLQREQENCLAQHIQARALLSRAERQRGEALGNVIVIGSR
jgi:hypothetical protein